MADYGKFHINGKRVHHGLIGWILYQLGVTQLGQLLMLDDIKDLLKWWRMED